MKCIAIDVLYSDMLRKHLSKTLTTTLILSGLFQCGYATAQLLGICMSGNPNYAFTGSFYNPGPYACYLVVGFPIALRMMVRGGMYVKTLRFSIPLHDIKYHKKTDRLYISTDAAPQFGYIEDFGKLIEGNVQEVMPVRNVKSDKTVAEDARTEAPITQAKQEESDEPEVEKTATASDDGKVKCIASDPSAAAAAKNSGSKSSAGPISLIDTNARGAHVDHLKVGAYPEGDSKYLYTIGLFNRSDEPVEIASICLPDGYFKASWSTGNTLKPNMVGFLRLTCDKPLDNKEYPVIVHFRDEKHPSQTLCMTLYSSGAQLYNEINKN